MTAARIRHPSRSRHARTRQTAINANAIGAYFVLSHGSAAIATPALVHERKLRAVRAKEKATTTQSAAIISGYTAKLPKRNGVVSATAAHAKVAPTIEPVSWRTHRHMNAEVSAATATRNATTPA